MIRAAIDRVIDLARAEIIDVATRKYATKELKPIYEPQPPLLKLSTLTSLVDYVQANFDQHEHPFKVHIMSPILVNLISEIHGPFQQRSVFVAADHNEPSKFKPGTYYDLEEFCILLRTSFVPTQFVADLLKVFGNVKGEAVSQWSDDGVSQSVQAKAGIALVQDVPIPSPVALQPYRTFREIAQPESPYIVRAKANEGKAPSVALFECEGDQWAVFPRAVDAIKGFLREALPEATIILGVKGGNMSSRSLPKMNFEYLRCSSCGDWAWMYAYLLVDRTPICAYCLAGLTGKEPCEPGA
ncbi:MAG: hypothetical protein AB9873_17825 [Syntrophobacteraceae bacterium]